jgi:hypothetical protein
VQLSGAYRHLPFKGGLVGVEFAEQIRHNTGKIADFVVAEPLRAERHLTRP